MKIDTGLLASYAISRQHRPSTGDDEFNESNRGNAIPREYAPTVAPSLPATSGFANTLWLIGAEKEEGSVAPAAAKSVTAEFLEWSKMSPAERIRAQILGELGLTEESLAALPPAEREVIEAEIREAIKRQLGIDDVAEASELLGVSPGEATAA